MAPLWNHTVSWKRNSLGISIYISESLSREENKFKPFCAKQSYHSVIFWNCLRRKMRRAKWWETRWLLEVVLIIWLLFPPPQMPFCFLYYDFANPVDNFPTLQPSRIFSLFFSFYPNHNNLWRPSSNLFSDKTLLGTTAYISPTSFELL